MVEELCYKLEDHKFNSRWGSSVIFSALNPSSGTMVPRFTKPVTEISTGSFLE
jgi:hypothetical protein